MTKPMKLTDECMLIAEQLKDGMKLPSVIPEKKWLLHNGLFEEKDGETVCTEYGEACMDYTKQARGAD